MDNSNNKSNEEESSDWLWGTIAAGAAVAIATTTAGALYIKQRRTKNAFIDDYFDDQNLCLVEWPEKAAGNLPVCDLDLELSIKGRSRLARFTSCSSFGREVIGKLQLAIKKHKF